MTGVAPSPKQPPPRAMHPPPPHPPPPNNLLHGAVEKQRRAGKYTHPFGGMRQFAEDRAARSGWDHDCLAIDNLESRRIARSDLADRISDLYKEEFVRVNKAQGKGRPKANNISAAKKTVRMIAERILLSLEARATQNMFKQLVENRRESEKELNRLRHIHNCGRENPKLSYDEIRAIARDRLGSMDDPSGVDAADLPIVAPDSPDFESAEAHIEIETMKQAIIEMRAAEVAKGVKPNMLNNRWVERMTHACKKLVQESYSRQFVPRTKVYGCKHFTRKNRILMVCCGTFPVCRMCHIQDLNRIHDVRIEPVKTMLCMMCGEVQPKTQKCRKCDECFGSYYCDVCGITDDTPGYDLRHCNKCNVCMPGLTFHCDKCKSCVPATPDHDAVCHGAGGAQNDSQAPQPVTVNTLTTPAESVDQSVTHTAANVDSQSNPLFTEL